MGAFTADAWMRTLHDKLMHYGLGQSSSSSIVAKDFEEHQGLFDEKKIRQMVHWELRLLV